MSKICRMGENYAFIKPNGDVERCCKDHSVSLGNIVKGTFKLLEVPIACNIEDCYCWRKMIVGEENKWLVHWGNLWDQFYFDEIRRIIIKLNNNNISFDDACKKYVLLKQQIQDRKTKEKDIDGLENNIVSNKLDAGWLSLEKNELKLAKEVSVSLLKNYNSFNFQHKVNILIYLARLSMVLKNFEKAKLFLGQIREINEKYPAMYKLLAMVEFELKNYNESIINFKKALKYAKRNNYKKELHEIYFEIYSCIKGYCNIKGIDVADNPNIEKMLNKLQNKTRGD